nr:hypothetical protein [Tanacetum cinerariifolium]
MQGRGIKQRPQLGYFTQQVADGKHVLAAPEIGASRGRCFDAVQQRCYFGSRSKATARTQSGFGRNLQAAHRLRALLSLLMNIRPTLVLLTLAASARSAFAQKAPSETEAVKQTVTAFFDGMRRGDSTVRWARLTPAFGTNAYNSSACSSTLTWPACGPLPMAGKSRTSSTRGARRSASRPHIFNLTRRPMEPKRYPRQLSRGANNAAIALSETEVGKLFGDDTRSDIGSEAEKMRFANEVNGLVVKFLRLETNEALGTDMLVMERIYPLDFRAYEV